MNIGLVLSGGMAKGAYQIGALKAISEFIPPSEIKYISGASVGALNGFAYATNNLSGVEEMWRTACNEDTRLLIGQILKSSMLQQCIRDLYIPDTKLTSNFYCALLDITHKSLVYKDLSTVSQELLPKYLKASVAMPIYNHPVKLDNVSYYDGAMIDNIPVYPLLKHSLDYIICLYFDDVCYKFENTYFDNKIIKISFPPDNRLKQSIVVRQESLDKMIENGYERTHYYLKAILSEGYDNLDYIYKAIDFYNRTHQNSKLRITGDVLVTNINKITQKLTKKKIL